MCTQILSSEFKSIKIVLPIKEIFAFLTFFIRRPPISFGKHSSAPSHSVEAATIATPAPKEIPSYPRDLI